MTEKLGNVYVCAPARPVWFICPPKMYELNESRGEKQLSSPAKCDLYPLLKWRTNWCLFQSYIFLPRLFLKVSFLLHVFSFVIPLSVLYRGNDHKMCIGQKMWGNKRNVWTVRNQRSLFWPVSLMKEMGGLVNFRVAFRPIACAVSLWSLPTLSDTRTDAATQASKPTKE